MKHLKLLRLFILVFACSIISCKKDKNSKKQPDCRFKSVALTRTGGNTTWDFNYNNEGKVASITTTNAAGVKMVVVVDPLLLQFMKRMLMG